MFYVDGLRMASNAEAFIVAQRLYKRYGGYRTIQIKDHAGEVVHEMEASKDYEAVDEDTIDWINISE